MKNKNGFTLIEMAMVLIIIGLILGMVFKGRQLIDNAKVKDLEAKFYKIQTGMISFYDRYGFYPGDGCLTKNPSTPLDCSGAKDGFLTTNEEKEAFWNLLIKTDFLSKNDRKTTLGDIWIVWYGTFHNITGNYLRPKEDIYDIRIVCALDQKIDDGKWNSGIVMIKRSTYFPDTDCWSLSGSTYVRIKILP